MKAVTKDAPSKIKVRQWLEGDLLLLAKPAVWSDVLMDLCQGSSPTRQWVNRNANSAIATSIATILLWRWNSTLVLALLMASSGSFVLYRVLQKPQPLRSLQQWIKEPQTPLILSFGSGIALLLFSYGALATAKNLQSPWLAPLLLSQEIGILLVLGLAISILLKQQSNKAPLSFDRCVAGLLHKDPLRRLMAVQQLAKLAHQEQLSLREQVQAYDYLQLLAHSESNPLVNKNIQDCLALMPPPQRPQLSAQSSAAVLPLPQPANVKLRTKMTADAS